MVFNFITNLSVILFYHVQFILVNESDYGKSKIRTGDIDDKDLIGAILENATETAAQFLHKKKELNAVLHSFITSALFQTNFR